MNVCRAIDLHCPSLPRVGSAVTCAALTAFQATSSQPLSPVRPCGSIMGTPFRTRPQILGHAFSSASHSVSRGDASIAARDCRERGHESTHLIGPRTVAIRPNSCDISLYRSPLPNAPVQPLSNGGNVSKKTEIACGFLTTSSGSESHPVAFRNHLRDTSMDAFVERGCVRPAPIGTGKCNRPYPLPRHKTYPSYEPLRGPVQPPTKNHNSRLNRHSRPTRPGA